MVPHSVNAMAKRAVFVPMQCECKWPVTVVYLIKADPVQCERRPVFPKLNVVDVRIGGKGQRRHVFPPFFTDFL